MARSIRESNVVVVGGAGFLGSHLVEHLIEDRNCKVLVVDNLCSGRREFVHRKAQFHHCDITGSETYLKRLFQSFDVDYVFNYAAIPYIPISFERPVYVFDVNAFGALKVINAAHESGAKGILQVSSAEIYGEGNPLTGNLDEHCNAVSPIDEGAPVIPHSSYGAAKAAIDAMVQVRWREQRVPCIALRQFNCVGERETHPYIVPEIIGQLSVQNCVDPGNLEEPLRGVVRLGNNSFRDFLYAGDAVRMATELLEEGKFGEVYNLGSESGIQIYDLAHLIGGVMGFDSVRIEEDLLRKRPWEIWHLQSDNSKVYGVIKSRPTINLRQAIQKTVKYFNHNNCKWCWE